MTGEKSNKIRDTRVSQAPKPPSPISTGGYRRKKDQLADYQHWNRMPVINLRQAIMLTLGIEPAPNIYEPPNQRRYVQLEQVALSHRQAGTLPVCAHDPDSIRSDDWLQWVRSNSDEEPPKEWQPIAASQLEMPVPKSSEVHSGWTIESAIADDVFNCMRDDNFTDAVVAGGKGIYDFLSASSGNELPDNYGLDVGEYWMADSELGSPGRSLDVGKRRGLQKIKILYKSKEDEPADSIKFRDLWKEFDKIKRKLAQ